MKITAVTEYPVGVGHRNCCIVKIETDEGIYGIYAKRCDPATAHPKRSQV